MRKKTRIITTEEDRVDITTGEVVSSTTRKVFSTKVDKVDLFFQIYFNQLNGLFGLKESELKVIIYLAGIANPLTGGVSLTAGKRKVLIDKLGISTSTLTKAMKALISGDFINGEDGEYLINPQIFWKGSSQDRELAIKTGIFKIIVEFEER